jgi:Ca2+-binding RTX toxin-like protein
VESFEFADGTVWSESDIVSHINTDENDVIYGFSGNDVITGGKGDDTLYGRRGNDTYLFNRGDGRDTIYDAYQSGSTVYDAGNDTLRFGEGISAEDLVLWMDGSNLIIDVGDGDRVAIQNQSNPNNAVERVELSDGSYLSAIDIEKLTEDIRLYVSDRNIVITDGDDIRSDAYLSTLIRAAWKTGDETYTPPIILDINANGVSSVSLESGLTYFDYDGDGVRERTAWAEKGDALLAADLNGDGVINDGSELFGTYTKLQDGSLAKDGYEALAQYDSNGDRVIDANDEFFSRLKLWIDANGDGVTNDGELTSLAINDISSIYLDNPDSDLFESYKENGNIVSAQTGYVTDVGGEGVVRDVWFKIDADDAIVDNDTIIGNGEAIILSGGEGDDVYMISRGFGYKVIDDNGDGADVVRFAESIAPDHVIIKWDGNSDGLLICVKESDDDDTAPLELSDRLLIKNWFSEGGKIERFEFGNGQVLDVNAIYDRLLEAKEDGFLDARVLNDGGELIGGSYGDILAGASGNETLNGADGDDYLIGLNGNDVLIGGSGHDALDGGEGEDTLIGGGGDDAYIFDRGYGKDEIYETAGTDSILLGSGIARDDVILKISGDDLIVALKEDGKAFDELTDTLTIKNYKDVGFSIENIEFSDGVSGNLASLDALDRLSEGEFHYAVLGAGSGVVYGKSSGDLILSGGEGDVIYGMGGADIIYGESGEDRLDGGEGDDNLYGGEGDDSLLGREGDDVLVGGEGNDNLYGGEGDDVLIGGEGDDKLYGGEGDDVYVITPNAGGDTIYDVGGSDTLLFGEGISKSDLIFRGSGTSLVIDVKGSGSDDITSSVNMLSWFTSAAKIETIRFSDGESADISSLFSVKPSSDSTRYALTNDGLKIFGSELNETICGSANDDIYMISKGGGKDALRDIGGYDVVKFADDVVKEDISFFISGGNLSLSYGEGDELVAQSDQIERFELSDGSYLTNSDVERIVQSINAYAVDNGLSVTSYYDVKNDAELTRLVNSGWNQV